MNKSQAIHAFWSSFGLPVYDEATVPTGEEAPAFPYITYNVATDSLGNLVALSGSLWYRSSSWEAISLKADEIAEYIGRQGFRTLTLDTGYVWLTKGSPFAQRMTDPDDDMIRRIYINVYAEFLTAY